MMRRDRWTDCASTREQRQTLQPEDLLITIPTLNPLLIITPTTPTHRPNLYD